MKNLRTYFLGSIVCLAMVSNLSAQETSAPAEPAKPDTSSSNGGKIIWTLGIHGVVVADGGGGASDLFNMDTWNFLPYPSRLTIDAAFDPHWSAELAISYTVYKKDKVVNDAVVAEDETFTSVDVNGKYHILPEGKFDIYPVLGLGYTTRSIDEVQTATGNLGLGFNIWFIKSFGLNLQTSAKFAFNSESSNYMMHSAGLVYRFGVK